MAQKREPMVLIYRTAPEQQEALRAVFAGLNVEARFIPEAQENAPVGLLAGNMGFKSGSMTPPPATDMTEPMLVLSDLSDRKLDFVLQALRKNGFSGILKCVMTPFNISWSGRQLQTELRRERTAIKNSRR